MRDIKFRGKRIDNGEWVYGGFYRGVMPEIDNPFSLDNARIKTIIIQEGTYYHVDPNTVGQYTGLKDKNGVEIYEGDILRLWRSKGQNGELRMEYAHPLSVIYSDLWCQFVVEDKPNKVQYGIWQAFNAFEVISNIHDNPELMEGAEP